jgi:hypothetical protein
LVIESATKPGDESSRVEYEGITLRFSSNQFWKDEAQQTGIPRRIPVGEGGSALMNDL